MNVLFIHQNFPGQYKHLAPKLASLGHKCVSLTLRVKETADWKGIRLLPYALSRKSPQRTHPWLLDFDSKVTRGDACFRAAIELKKQGFNPDIILAHPGWGESMFLRDVWPNARFGIYCELYHLSRYPYVNFDPEFEKTDNLLQPLRIRLKNLNNHIHFQIANAGISPTNFQANTFPPVFRDKITVCHDGIDTNYSTPNPNVRLTINDVDHEQTGSGVDVTRQDEVVTFVNRNLEPYRGYHTFMRALPQLLRTRPNARILIVGGDETGYGEPPPQGQTWKQIFIDEVRSQISISDWKRVHFLGRIPHNQLTRLLQVSRVHIYLTYPFVLSWSLMEAMSCQAAIVASDTAPVREVIRDGETGILTDFFDPVALVEKVNNLLDDSKQRTELGQAARMLVKTKYDLKSHCLPQLIKWTEKLAQLSC